MKSFLRLLVLGSLNACTHPADTPAPGPDPLVGTWTVRSTSSTTTDPRGHTWTITQADAPGPTLTFRADGTGQGALTAAAPLFFTYAHTGSRLVLSATEQLPFEPRRIWQGQVAALAAAQLVLVSQDSTFSTGGRSLILRTDTLTR